jgi:hypothetical protein
MSSKARSLVNSFNDYSSFIQGAPEALDTLSEITAAINNDADFIGTMNTALGGKLGLSGGNLTGDLGLGDNNKIQLGASDDLEIYHDGSNSYIDEVGVGDLIIRSSTSIQLANAAGTETYLIATENSGVSLNYDNNTKLSTTNTGVSVTGDVTVSGNVDGRDVATDGSKLDLIEASATADQSNAEIKTAYEANADTNEFSDAEQTKLAGIEASATADQTATEIKTAYESNSDTNEYSDAEQSKLSAIEASATADQTNAEIKAAVEAASDSNTFTDADHSKLNAIEASATADQSNAEIKTAVEAGTDIALGGNPTTTTQSAGNSSTRIATTAYTDTAVSNLVDSSPAALNTLNELAAALGDDANFSTTVTNSIATKLPLAGGTMTGAIAMGANKVTGLGTPTATTDAATKAYVDALDALPSQATHAGEYLTTNATTASWAALTTDLVGDTTPQLGGDLDTNSKNISFGDSSGSTDDRLTFGASDDLQIYHDGSNSYISDQGTNDLKVLATDFQLKNAADNEFMMTAVTDGAVNLYHNGSAKIATTATGVNITGGIVADHHINIGVGMSFQWGDSHERIEQSDGKIEFFTDNSEKMTLNGSNLGIGTSSPVVKLSVKSSQEQLTLSEGDARGATFDYRSSTGNLQIATNGVNARTSPQLTLDLNGNVGIGTSSPATGLHLLGSDNLASSLTLQNTAPTPDNIWRITPFYNSGDLGFLDDGTERLRITSTGYVDIAGASDVRLTLGSQGTAGNNDANWIRGNGTSLSYNAASANHIWETGGAEKMRMDSSGNLLVGKTSSDTGNSLGFEARQNGLVNIGRDGGEPLLLNRNNSDGGILLFRKDGTTVGSIGTQGGDLSIGTGDTALYFNDGSDSFYPWTVTGNTTRDAAINIGSSTTRFKDLHLSGTVRADSFSGGSTTRSITISESNGNDSAIIHASSGDKLELRANSNTYNQVVLAEDGNVGISTASPVNFGTNSQGLTINGTGNYQNLTLQVNGATQFYIYTNGASGTFIATPNADPLIFVTNDTERLRLDSAGNMGLGVVPKSGWSSSYAALQVGDGASIYGHKSSYNAIISSNVWYEGLSPSYYSKYLTNGYASSYRQDTGTHTFQVASSGTADAVISWTDAMTIANDGNVGIGTSSPSKLLHLQSASTPTIRLTDTTNTAELEILSGNSEGYIGMRSAHPLIFITGNVEKMRIDSSGNVLVGKTTTSFGTQGIRLEGSNGKIESTRNGNIVMALNRLTSDGTIVEFAKDGTTAGNIGVHTSNEIYISNGSNVGLRTEQSGTDRIEPCNGTGVIRDGAIDLGSASARFGNFYVYNNISLSNASTSAFFQVSSNIFQAGTSSNDPVVFYSNNTERLKITSGGVLASKHTTGYGYLSFLSASSGGSYLNVKTNIYRADTMYMLKILGFASYSGQHIDTVVTGYAYSPYIGNTGSSFHGITNHGTVGVSVYYSSDDYLCFKLTSSGSYNSVDIIASTGGSYAQSTPVELLSYAGSGSSSNYF